MTGRPRKPDSLDVRREKLRAKWRREQKKKYAKHGAAIREKMRAKDHRDAARRNNLFTHIRAFGFSVINEKDVHTDTTHWKGPGHRLEKQIEEQANRLLEKMGWTPEIRNACVHRMERHIHEGTEVDEGPL